MRKEVNTAFSPLPTMFSFLLLTNLNISFFSPAATTFDKSIILSAGKVNPFPNDKF